VFGQVVAHQGGPDRLDGGPAVAITHRSQHAGITLAAHDGADDAHPCGPRHVGDDMVQLKVHEGQRLLHMLDVGGRVVQMSFPEPQVGSKRSDVATGSEAWAQQGAGMEPLQPLRIVDVALAAWHGARFACVGHDDLKATVLKDLVGRNPVHAGGLHRHGLDPERYEPVGHTVEVGREGLESLYRLIAQVWWYRNDMESGSNVDGCRPVVDDGQTCRLAMQSGHDRTSCWLGTPDGGLGWVHIPKRGRPRSLRGRRVLS
jgi:hypothetical protein